MYEASTLLLVHGSDSDDYPNIGVVGLDRSQSLF
jgi:hypothetical protein